MTKHPLLQVPWSDTLYLILLISPAVFVKYWLNYYEEALLLSFGETDNEWHFFSAVFSFTNLNAYCSGTVILNINPFYTHMYTSHIPHTRTHTIHPYIHHTHIHMHHTPQTNTHTITFFLSPFYWTLCWRFYPGQLRKKKKLKDIPRKEKCKYLIWRKKWHI